MISIYKPIGQTCGELIQELMESGKYDKLAFCGRLDPMAHGNMLVLYNDETKNINTHLSHDKTYEFRFVIGFSTDTTDVMGVFNNEQYSNEIDLDVLLKYINDTEKNKYFKQKYHKFSSFMPKQRHPITNKRMPLWYWYMKNSDNDQLNLEDLNKDVIIYNLNVLSVAEKYKDHVVCEAINNIKKVKSQDQFRIPIILDQYNADVFPREILFEIKMRMTVSSGFYIRQYVQDLSDYFKVKMMVIEIYRVEVIVR